MDRRDHPGIGFTHSGSARANAGIIDLGDSTVIFDTFAAPAQTAWSNVGVN